ncbi:MAG: TolC family protein [Flavipsychrobacter sp.]|nr:TolC family protein [Flavipsychrobacter sp.]
MLRLLLVVFACVAATPAYTQSSDEWTLERSVQYAVQNNLTIKQSELNARLAKFTLQQSQLQQLPNLNGSANYGRSFGRSVNPVTNQFEESNYDFLSLGANANVLLFGWFQQRNLIKSNKFGLEASKADLDQMKNDISLNVANGFLRAVLAKEQIRIFERQVELSKAQLAQTDAFVKAGRLPELNLAQLQAQVANDSASLINAIAGYNSALIDMRALLNLDFTVPFDITVPEVKVGDQLALQNMNPGMIYEEARRNFGSVKGAKYRVDAASSAFKAAQGGLWPNLTVGGQLGSNWASSYRVVDGYTVGGIQPTGAYTIDSVNQVIYQVYQPSVTPRFIDVPLGKQLDNNLRQTVSLNLNIPIFNGWQAQYNVRQSKINYLRQQLNLDQAELTLKQNVYVAYNEAVNAVQKYNAAERGNAAAQRALEFARQRYELGLINTVEYLVTQNTANTSASNFAIAKYELIFKLKVIDYYLGKELKL